MRRWVIVAAIWALGACAAGAQTTSPLAGSDQIRAARPLAEVDALVFDLRREVTPEGGPAVVTTGVVTLAPTFSHLVEGEQHAIEDHLLCRSLQWSGSAHTLENVSCYAAVAFRELEIQNRRMLAKVTAKAGVDEPESIYMSEVELGVLSGSGPALKAQPTRDGTRYLLGQSSVTEVGGSAGAVSTEEMRRFARFLARHVRLHPQVRRDLLSSDHLPGVIRVERGSSAMRHERYVVSVSNLRRVRVAYPLPSGLESALAVEARSGTAPRHAAVRRAAEVIAGEAPRPTAESLVAGMRKAADEDRDLQALLLFMELTQEHAGALNASTGLREQIGPLLRRLDGRDYAQFMEASRLAGDGAAEGDRPAAARFIASQRGRELQFGTFLNVTYANLLAVSRDVRDWPKEVTSAMPAQRADNYWIHIAAHPWSANTYKDVGDAYYAAYEVGHAWTAFDLGRAADPSWREGVMTKVADYEDVLRKREPDFF